MAEPLFWAAPPQRLKDLIVHQLAYKKMRSKRTKSRVRKEPMRRAKVMNSVEKTYNLIQRNSRDAARQSQDQKTVCAVYKTVEQEPAKAQ